jgi:hypothetical protein
MRNHRSFVWAALCLLALLAVPATSGISEARITAGLKSLHWAGLYRVDVNVSYGDHFLPGRVRKTGDGGLAIGMNGWADHASWSGEQMTVLKLDARGRTVWATAPLTCGDDGYCTVKALAILSDGRIAVLAHYLFQYDSEDGYLVLMVLGSNGAFKWMKTFLGTYDAEGYYDLQPAANGGMLVAGALKQGHWVARLNSTGRITWQGRLDAAIYALQRTSDGGFIAAGVSGDFDSVSSDAWIAKFNAVGGITWQKALGDPAAADCFHRVIVMGDGYLAAGETRGLGASAQDSWVVRFDWAGHIRWQHAFARPGSGSSTTTHSIARLHDGGILECGDGFVLKLNAQGNIVWQRQYSASMADGIELGSGDLALIGEPADESTCWPVGIAFRYILAGRFDSAGRIGPDCCLVSDADLGGRATVAVPYITHYSTIHSPAMVRNLDPTDPGPRAATGTAVCQADAK